MKRKYSCTKCKEKFDLEELTQVSKSVRVCKKCLETRQEDSRQYKALIDFICNGFKLKAPTGQQLKTIKKFKEIGYSYLDIHKLLYYVAIVKKYEFKGSNIEIIFFYAEEAKKYYEQIEKTISSAEKAVCVKSENVVECSIDFSEKPKGTRLIDISEIF